MCAMLILYNNTTHKMKTKIVKPIIADNGIEFYVSEDGEEAGVSVRGLARLCGVSTSTISDVFGKNAPEATKSLLGEDYGCSVGFEGVNGAKIITSKAASKIIYYYAVESKAVNDTAKHSLKRFAQIGFTTWVKEVTGYAESNDIRSLTNTVNSLVRSVDSLTEEVKSWRTVKKVADNRMPGINVLIEEIEKGEAEKLEGEYTLLPPDAPVKTWTLAEWLSEFKRVTLQRGAMVSLGQMVASTYKAHRQKNPMRAARVINGNNAVIAVYEKEDFPFLSMCFVKYMMGV